MEISTSVFRVYLCCRDVQIAHHFDSFNRSIPIAWILTVCDNKLINVKMFIGAMPIYIRIFMKVISNYPLILSQDRFQKMTHIHNCHTSTDYLSFSSLYHISLFLSMYSEIGGVVPLQSKSIKGQKISPFIAEYGSYLSYVYSDTTKERTDPFCISPGPSDSTKSWSF